MKKTILVCGGAGYIGSHTSYLLAQQGYRVIILDTYIHNQKFEPSWATIIKKDFADPRALQEIFTSYRVDAVMHFAALIEVGESVHHPAKYYENNVVKTKQLLDSMLAHGVKKFIFSSSAAVYGLPQEVPLKETHPKEPVNPYGRTKLMVEFLLGDYARAYGLEYVSLRYFNAAGALPEVGLGEQHSPESHVIPLMLHAAYLKKEFSMFGIDYPTKDGSCVRDYLHVIDIARAHVMALDHLERTHTSECFNLGTGCGYSVRELVAAVEQVTGAKMNVRITDRREGDPSFLVADASKAKALFGWEPQYSNLIYILQSSARWEEMRLHLREEAVGLPRTVA